MNTAFIYCNASYLQYFFHSQAGPNAPLQWVRESVQALSPDSNEQRKKVFVGLNFYGMDYSPSGGSGSAMDYNGYLVDLHGGGCQMVLEDVGWYWKMLEDFA